MACAFPPPRHSHDAQAFPRTASIGKPGRFVDIAEQVPLCRAHAAGCFSGLVAALCFCRSAPQRPRIRHPLLLLKYIFMVGYDVILSNIAVACDLLRLHRRPPNSGFVRIPLDLHDPSGLAALAIVTAVVPGTVWCELTFDKSSVLLHVWDLKDEADFIAYYKNRYEAPLLKIYT